MGCANGVAVREDHMDNIGVSRDSSSFEQEYSVGKMLGKGAFGKVYAAIQTSTGKRCAVKCIELVDEKHSQEKQIEQAAAKKRKAKMEIETWQAVGKHPNIVELHGWFAEQSRVFLMVMEKCTCTASEKLNSGSFRKSDMPWVLREMLLGVEACHLAHVVHRDIKTDNYLISKDGNKIKLCDFGLAAQVKPGTRGASLLKGEVGTPPLMSPEMLTGKSYDTSTDIWSFGAMAYFTLFKELPYIPKEVSAKAAKEATRVGVPPPRFLEGVPRHHDKSAIAFIRGLLERNPGDRVTAAEALEHPYLQEQLKPLPGQIETASTLAPMEGSVDYFSSEDSQSDGEDA